MMPGARRIFLVIPLVASTGLMVGLQEEKPNLVLIEGGKATIPFKATEQDRVTRALLWVGTDGKKKLKRATDTRLMPPWDKLKTNTLSTRVEFQKEGDYFLYRQLGENAGIMGPTPKHVGIHVCPARAMATVPQDYDAFKERKIATLPESKNIKHIVVSGNGRSFAYSVHEANSAYVVLNGRKGITYDNVGDAQFSPDGSKFAYSISQGKKMFFMTDRGKMGPYTGINVEVQFSRDSSAWVLSACKDEKLEQWYLNTNGTEAGPYPSLSNLALSPDGKHLAFVVEEKGKAIVILDGKRRKAYNTVAHLQFTGDGKSLVHTASVGDQEILIVGGKQLKGPADPWKIAVGKTSNDIAYTYLDETSGEMRVWFCNESTGEYPNVKSIAIGDGGSSLAFIVKDKKTFVVFNGKKQEEFDDIENLRMSPDGKRVAYLARQNDKLHVIAGDRKSEPFDADKNLPSKAVFRHLGGPLWSENSNKVAYSILVGHEIWWKVIEVK